MEIVIPIIKLFDLSSTDMLFFLILNIIFRTTRLYINNIEYEQLFT